MKLNQIIFKILFKKIPKTDFGRCVNCHANLLCGYKVKCKATMNEQYKIRDIFKDFAPQRQTN